MHAREFAEAEAQAGIDGRRDRALRGPAKRSTCCPWTARCQAEDFIASNELLDPESVDAMLDPIARAGSRKSWDQGPRGGRWRIGPLPPMNLPSEIVPDSERRGLIGALPPQMRPFASLMRLDRPIGTWLLFWPCAWSVALAGVGGRWSAVRVVRGWRVRDAQRGMRLQRYRRPRARPVGRADSVAPAGERAGDIPGGVGAGDRLCLIGLAVLFQLDRTAQLVAVASLALVAAYPFMKRITWWPQAWLGLVFSWGALVGWPAVTGDARYACVWLYIGTVAWVIGYDTLYAIQDVEDDALVGVKSSARRLGDKAPLGVAIFYALAIGAVGDGDLVGSARLARARRAVPAAVHLANQVLRADPKDGAGALALVPLQPDLRAAGVSAMLVVGTAFDHGPRTP